MPEALVFMLLGEPSLESQQRQNDLHLSHSWRSLTDT